MMIASKKISKRRQIEKMELISYEEAAKILGVSVSTVFSAASRRGVLTRVARTGRNVRLIKDQVLLFVPSTGKRKRLSLETLSDEERREWQRYKDEYMSPDNLDDVIKQQVKQSVDEKVKGELARRELQRLNKLKMDIAKWEDEIRLHLQEE
jgi:excisionase family DNA binding protein